MTQSAETNQVCLISVVVPVYNEESGIPQLCDRLGRVRAQFAGSAELEFVFVDDGSSDATYLGLRTAFDSDPMTRVVRHDRNRGIGAAFRTGFAQCRGAIVCTIDADCSYGPENLALLVTALRQRKADIAVASPYHPEGSVDGVPEWRLALSRGCSWLYRTIAPVKLYTYTSVFRAYTKEVVNSVPFQEDGFTCASEILVRAAQRGYTVAEIPMVLHARKFGRSKMKIARTVRAHLRLIGTIVAGRIRNQFGLDARASKPADSVIS